MAGFYDVRHGEWAVSGAGWIILANHMLDILSECRYYNSKPKFFVKTQSGIWDQTAAYRDEPKREEVF
jgi:hypothetical protein